MITSLKYHLKNNSVSFRSQKNSNFSRRQYLVQLFVFAAIVASTQAGVIGHGGLGLGYGGIGLGLAHGGIVAASPVVTAPAIASPVIATSAVTTRADAYTPLVAKTIAPVGLASVGVAAAPIGLGIGLGHKW